MQILNCKQGFVQCYYVNFITINKLLTGTCPLMMTSSAKRTLTGLVFNLAFLAALINADLGDLNKKKGK